MAAASVADDLAIVYACSPVATLGEGPCWDSSSQCLYWVDIERFQVHVWHPSSRTNDTVQLTQHIGCGTPWLDPCCNLTPRFSDRIGAVVPRTSGGVVCALRDGVYSLDLNSRELRKIADPEPNAPERRFNDGKCDSRYAACLNYAAPVADSIVAMHVFPRVRA